MSIFEYENEDAIEVLADILEPAMKICADEVLQAMVRNNKPNLMIAQHILRKHSKEIVAILAASERKPVSEYHATILSMMKGTLELLNNKDIMDFFYSQAQMMQPTSFGEPMANTEEKEQ